LAASALVLLVVGCGGGGGNASGSMSSEKTETPTTSDTTTSTNANVITLSLVNAAGAVVNSVSFGAGQSLKVQYATSAGVPIANTLVSFSVTTNATAVNLSTATALTNSSGVASVSINPASAATVGAATVKATAGAVSTSLDFGISATSVSLGNLELGNSSLTSGGITTVRTTASANSALASGVSVSFGATCGTLTPAIAQTDGNGVASSSYSAVKSDGSACSGSVTVSALAAGSTQTNTLNVLAPVASAVNFVSASPAQIYVLGSGATTQSIVKFKVLNATGGNFSGADVAVSLTSKPGGVGLGVAGSTAALSLTTNADGLVTFTVFSGTVPGPLELRASILNDSVYAVSKNLTVRQGPPSQKFFSLAADRYYIEGKDYEGTTATLTVQAADRNGNPVPAGTVVNFTAEGGQVSPSCTIALIDDIASCTATFSSQSPRPADMRISILAYAEGMKDYVDKNKNNTFDAGDTLTEMGDAYRDDNDESTLKQYDPGEFTIERGGALACTGAGGPAPAVANTCTGTTATTVRKQVVLTMSGSVAVFNDPVVTSSKITFTLTDGNTARPNPMPDGTTLLATAIDNTPLNDLACTVKPDYGTTIGGASAGTTSVTINLKDCATSDEVTVDVTTPKLNKTSLTFTTP
jgi:hypothetical protein